MKKSEVLISSVKTQAGLFSFASVDGVVIEATFGNRTRLKSKGRNVRSVPGVSTALNRYLEGDLRSLQRIKVKEFGTAFHRKVMREMRKIAPGRVLTYGQLAKRAGIPGAARAVGTACSSNPIPLIVPCHRVTRSDGSLGNYGYGIKAKRDLLTFEGALENK